MTDVLEPAPSEGVGSSWHPALKDFVAGEQCDESNIRHCGPLPEMVSRHAKPLTVQAESAERRQT